MKQLPQTCLVHASVTCSSHRPAHIACAQKRVAAHASSCSISRLSISKKSETETGNFFPSTVFNCFLNISFEIVPCPKRSGSSCCSWYHTRSQTFVDPFPHVHVPELCCFIDSSHTLSSSSSFLLPSFLFRLTRSVPKYSHVVCPTESFCVRETYAAP